MEHGITPPAPAFFYAVTGTFTDPPTAARWIAWLHDEHLAEVVAAGAVDAEVIALDRDDDGPTSVEVRYRFADRDAFARYERDHAPALRAKGVALFPPSDAIRLARRKGEIVTRRQR